MGGQKEEKKISSITDSAAHKSFIFQLNKFKSKKGSTLKESLVCFYNEVSNFVNEMNVLTASTGQQDDEE